MTDEATSLIMEQLHILRRGQEALREDMTVFKERIMERMTGFETNLAHVLAQIGHLQMQVANHTNRDRMEVRSDRVEQRLERIEDRLGRIERRLDLTHA
jgi:hypothetical protein